MRLAFRLTAAAGPEHISRTLVTFGRAASDGRAVEPEPATPLQDRIDDRPGEIIVVEDGAPRPPGGLLLVRSSSGAAGDDR
jgi:hypothetical protein